MAISRDLQLSTPEESAAEDSLAAIPPNGKRGRTRNTSTAIDVPTDEDTNPAVLDPEDGGAEGLPDSEEYEQILEELRTAKTEQAVSARRNIKLTLDKVTFGITGAIAIAFVIWGFTGRDS
ncbi:BCCT family transporter, partial [Pseudarthrobacter sp. YS3]